MEWLSEDVIYEYTDEQAVEVGVFVAWQHSQVNRISRAVFDHFTSLMVSSLLRGPVTDSTRLS